jgi:hypothetical protein
MTARRSLAAAIASALIVAVPFVLPAQTFEVRLKRAWASKYANRATIDALMEVRFTHKTANQIASDGDDGDMHFSGVSNDVGLPFVAEIVNAGLPPEAAAVAEMKAKQASGVPLQLRGAWRLWFEHPAKTQTQGGTNAFLPNNTNPNHSFEIHPLSRVGQFDIGNSFVLIKGYTAYTADESFPYFDQHKITIKASSSGISIRSTGLTHNYVEFDIDLTHPPQKVSDGYIALATVLKGDDQEAAAGERRMIFLDGTAAATKIASASTGDRLHVLGIPRINLDAVLSMVTKHGTKQFDAQLPYEMIIVGVK